MNSAPHRTTPAPFHCLIRRTVVTCAVETTGTLFTAPWRMTVHTADDEDPSQSKFFHYSGLRYRAIVRFAVRCLPGIDWGITVMAIAGNRLCIRIFFQRFEGLDAVSRARLASPMSACTGRSDHRCGNPYPCAHARPPAAVRGQGGDLHEPLAAAGPAHGSLSDSGP